MKNKLKYISLGFLALVLILGAGVSTASAALTLGALAITSDGALSLNATSNMITGTPVASSTGALLRLGDNALTAPSGANFFAASSTGTLLAANPSSFTGDFLNFQIDGDSKFRVRAPIDSSALGYGLLSVTNNATTADTITAWDQGSLAFITQVTTESSAHVANAPSIGLQVNNGVSYTSSHTGYNVWGAYLRARTYGTGATTGAVGGLKAVHAEAAVYSTGMNITDVVGIESYIAYWGSSGTVTNAYSLYAGANVGGLSAGAVTNMYGLYIQAGYNAKVTNSWGIAQAGNSDNNYFGGKTRIASSGTAFSATQAPYGQLDVFATPTASANYGVLNIGPVRTAFDGSTSGFFAGSASGTQLAVNAVSGFAGNLIDVQTAGVSKFKVDATGNVMITTTQTPASASAACTTGTVTWDSGFVYVCTATNTWKRAAIATW